MLVLQIGTSRTRSGAWILGLVAGALLWLHTPTARAQTGDPAAARVLFQEALKAARAGDHAAACPKFSDSYRLDPTFGALFNLASCEERQGKLVSAWVAFQKAAEMLKEGDPRRGQTGAAITDLDGRLPRLTIRLAGNAPTGTSVERDGIAVAESGIGVALPLDPGHHVITVRSPGYEDRHLDFSIVEGESREILAESGAPRRALPPESSTVQGPPIQAATPLHSLPPSAPTRVPVATSIPPQILPSAESAGGSTPYLLGGLGILGIAAGVVTRVTAFSQQSTIDANCDGDGCNTTGMSAVSRARTLQTISTISLAVGVAGLGTGIYLLVSNSKSPATNATIAPVVLRSGAGLALHQRF